MIEIFKSFSLLIITALVTYFLVSMGIREGVTRSYENCTKYGTHLPNKEVVRICHEMIYPEQYQDRYEDPAIHQ